MENIIEIDNLTKEFKDKKAVDGITLDIGCGIHGLVGPNGAGKTTFLKLLAGLIRPGSGSISFRGRNIKDMGSEYNRHISYMPQEFGFYPFYTGFEIMDYFRILKESDENKEKIYEILENVNLTDKADKKIRTYSGGMKRRLGIATMLLGKPDLMIFDEPTAGLDPEERVRFKKILSTLSTDRAIIVSTHILSDVESLCDKIYFMENGRIVRQLDSIEKERRITGDLEDKYMEIMGKQ